jgi:hypothetical protein
MCIEQTLSYVNQRVNRDKMGSVSGCKKFKVAAYGCCEMPLMLAGRKNQAHRIILKGWESKEGAGTNT